jgi:membrane protease YdiL (CAAX protease family)
VASRSVAAALALSLVAACLPLAPRARLRDATPTLPREDEAQAHFRNRRCDIRHGALWVPGLPQICLDRPREGGVLMGVALGELATGVTVAAQTSDGVEHPGAAVPLLGFADLWIYSQTDALLMIQRADEKRFVPQDTSRELFLAPWNPRVLSRTDVWLGIIGFTVAGVGVSWLAGEFDPRDTTHVGERPNLFGRTVSSPVGYPLAGAVGVATFEQVAVAEEALFRGFLQSGLSRAWGENAGWVVGSLIFGAAHAPNAYFVPEGQRAKYLLVGVPFLTLGGAYLGWVYRHAGYRLAPSTAVHFWYDLLISGVGFALDPQHSPLSVTISLPL